MRKLQREEDKLLKPPEREGLDSEKPGSKIAALSERRLSQEPGCNQFLERTEALCRDEPAVGNNELSLEKLLVQGDSGSPM